jgi:hypothetical protein
MAFRPFSPQIPPLLPAWNTGPVTLLQHEQDPAAQRPSKPVARGVWGALWASRLVILLSGLAGVVQVGIANGAISSYDPTGVTRPFGYLPNAALGAFARWDSFWYLTIAKHGYAHVRERMAFYPLYPGLIHVLAWVTRSDVIAGVLISLAAFAVGLTLLHRLVSLDFGPEVATATVLLVAFCPMSFFLSAIYTEPLFLALSVGSIYAARRERWWLCGLLGLLAATSRNGGIVLILPAAVIYLYGPRTASTAASTRWAGARGWRRLLPRYRLRLNALWLLLIPAGLGAYLAYLWITYNEPLAPFSVETVWYRHTTLPWTTIWHGAVQAWHGLRQLIQGPVAPDRVPAYAQSVISDALQDVYLFLFLILGVVGLVAVAWRLGAAYALYTLALLTLALADPVSLQPLASLPRYELIIFPLFICGAQLLVRFRLMAYAVPALAVLLGLFTVEFATWRWVA